jgi:hypothetical protein
VKELMTRDYFPEQIKKATARVAVNDCKEIVNEFNKN